MAIFTKTGIGAVGRVATTYIKTGSGVTAFTAAGGAPKNYNKTGITYVGCQGSGVATITGAILKTGGTGGGSYSGLLLLLWQQTGFVGSGSKSVVKEYNKTGSGVSAFSGSAFKGINNITKTGIGISAFSGSGPKTITNYTKTGSGISAFVGSGADVVTFVETGSGVSAFSGSSPKTVTHIFTKTGAGVSAFTASGPSSHLFPKTGSGVTTFNGSGFTSSRVYNKSGSGVSDFTGSGSRTALRIKTGMGITSFVGSGVKSIPFLKTGAGVSAFSGSGPRTTLKERSGLGSAAFTALGTAVRSAIPVKTGTGIAGFGASGSRLISYARTGTGILSAEGSGALFGNPAARITLSGTGDTSLASGGYNYSGKGGFIIRNGVLMKMNPSGILYAIKYVGEANVPHDIKRQRRFTFELMRRMGTPVLIKKMYTDRDYKNGEAVPSPNFHGVYKQTRNEDPISYGIGYCSRQESENEYIDPSGKIYTSEFPVAGGIKAPKYRGFGQGVLTYLIEPDVAEDFYKLTQEGALIRFQHARAIAPWWPDVNDNDLVIHCTLDKNNEIVSTTERYQARMVNPISIRGLDRRGRREYGGEYGNRYVINQQFEMMLVPPQNILYKVETDR